MALALRGHALGGRIAVQRPRKVSRVSSQHLAPKARGALQVVAYRDAATSQSREDTVNAIGRDTLDAWFKGIKEGSSAASGALQQYLVPEVTFRRDQALTCEKGKGIDFVSKQLDKEHSEMHLEDYRIVATAASNVDDTFFGLVEYRYSSKAAGSNSTCLSYKVVEMDILLDDGARSVVCIHERGQLSAEDVEGVSSEGAQALCNPAFPKERLGPFPSGLTPDKVLHSVQGWCKARSSGQSEEELDNVLDPSFRMWDAFGVIDAQVGSDNAKPDTVVPFDKVKDILRRSKDSYDIDCHLVDNAMAKDANVGFSHWRSSFTPKGGDDKATFKLEGIEVELFNADGKITDIWLFRDPMDFERRMLQKNSA